MAAVAVANEDAIRSARLSGTATAMRTQIGFKAMELERTMAERTEGAGRAALGDEVWEFEHARGAAMTLDEAVAYALEAIPDV
jgi:hypothetical protein